LVTNYKNLLIFNPGNPITVVSYILPGNGNEFWITFLITQTVILVSGTELECANTNSLVNNSYTMPVSIKFLINLVPRLGV